MDEKEKDFVINGTDTKPNDVSSQATTSIDNITQNEILNKYEGDVLFKKSEAAAYLRVNEETLQRYREKYGLPSIKINPSKVLYSKKEIDIWLKKQGGK